MSTDTLRALRNAEAYAAAVKAKTIERQDALKAKIARLEDEIVETDQHKREADDLLAIARARHVCALLSEEHRAALVLAHFGKAITRADVATFKPHGLVATLSQAQGRYRFTAYLTPLGHAVARLCIDGQAEVMTPTETATNATDVYFTIYGETTP